MQKCTKMGIGGALLAYLLVYTSISLMSLGMTFVAYIFVLAMGIPVPIFLGWLATALAAKYEAISCRHVAIFAAVSFVVGFFFTRIMLDGIGISADNRVIYILALIASMTSIGIAFQVSCLMMFFVARKALRG